MNQFEITLQGLNNGVLQTLTFPCEMDEAAKVIVNVSEYGQHDFEIVDYDAPFPIDELHIMSLNEIAEMPQEKYEAFISFCNCGLSFKEAVKYVVCYEYRVYNHVDDMSDVAYQMLHDDIAFNKAPSFMRIHFDYNSYGETLCAGGEWYEDTVNKRIIQMM